MRLLTATSSIRAENDCGGAQPNWSHQLPA